VSAPDYRLIDHTADIAFEVEAPSWPDLLARATAALGDILLAVADRPAGEEEMAVEVGGADREDVLVAWLNEAALLFEDAGFHAVDAALVHADETTARGRLLGRTIDFAREPPDRLVKAVTYHDLEVVEGTDGRPWKATIVLDL
jgi:SHS2 domain-containing protein